jgi:hypothetical protein
VGKLKPTKETVKTLPDSEVKNIKGGSFNWGRTTQKNSVRLTKQRVKDLSALTRDNV